MGLQSGSTFHGKVCLGSSLSVYSLKQPDIGPQRGSTFHEQSDHGFHCQPYP